MPLFCLYKFPDPSAQPLFPFTQCREFGECLTKFTPRFRTTLRPRIACIKVVTATGKECGAEFGEIDTQFTQGKNAEPLTLTKNPEQKVWRTDETMIEQT